VQDLLSTFRPQINARDFLDSSFNENVDARVRNGHGDCFEKGEIGHDARTLLLVGLEWSGVYARFDVVLRSRELGRWADHIDICGADYIPI
jgi:hypothetical protein